MRSKLVKTLEEILSKFPSDKLIDDLLPDDRSTGHRIYSITATDGEIMKWRKVLKKEKDAN